MRKAEEEGGGRSRQGEVDLSKKMGVRGKAFQKYIPLLNRESTECVLERARAGLKF